MFAQAMGLNSLSSGILGFRYQDDESMVEGFNRGLPLKIYFARHNGLLEFWPEYLVGY